ILGLAPAAQLSGAQPAANAKRPVNARKALRWRRMAGWVMVIVLALSCRILNAFIRQVGCALAAVKFRFDPQCRSYHMESNRQMGSTPRRRCAW
ncbi:hypothetical protein N9104_04210, partial [Pseudomonadales bacterium]|nr:hypothetical protein [Pseudomonadales bacterium]